MNFISDSHITEFSIVIVTREFVDSTQKVREESRTIELQETNIFIIEYFALETIDKFNDYMGRRDPCKLRVEFKLCCDGCAKIRSFFSGMEDVP